MLAIVDINGKQYQVQEGRYVTVDRMSLEENATFEIGNVLMVVNGEESLVGAPFVDGAVVRAKVLRHSRGPKLLVYKMRCKKGYRRKNGHRQNFTQLQIEVVDFPGRKDQPKAAEPAAAPKRASKKADESAEKAPKAKAPKAAAKSAAPKAEKKPAKAKAEEAKPAEVAENTEA